MNNKISTKLKDGTIKEFDVLFTFTNNTNNKDYIVYTDNVIDQENKLRIFAAIYNPFTQEFLGEPETKEEWDEIYKLLDKILLEN